MYNKNKNEGQIISNGDESTSHSPAEKPARFYASPMPGRFSPPTDACTTTPLLCPALRERERENRRKEVRTAKLINKINQRKKKSDSDPHNDRRGRCRRRRPGKRDKAPEKIPPPGRSRGGGFLPLWVVRRWRHLDFHFLCSL